MVQQSSEQKHILCWDHGFFYHLECVVGMHTNVDFGCQCQNIIVLGFRDSQWRCSK